MSGLTLRENFRAGRYANIAMKHYWDARTLSNAFNSRNETEQWDYQHASKEIEDEAIQAIIFSAMCIESFVNDYVASKLSDKMFKDHFDNLDVPGKMQLIFLTVFHAEMDAGKSYYSLVKKLISSRNDYTHSKSREVQISNLVMPTYKETSKDNKAALMGARDAIRAIYELAKCFDMHDPSLNAITILFQTQMGTRDEQYRSTILKELSKK